MGVSLLDHKNKTAPLYLSEENWRAEKSATARQAVGLIHEGDIIVMDASSAVLKIAEYLKPNIKITVIINSARAAAAL